MKYTIGREPTSWEEAVYAKTKQTYKDTESEEYKEIGEMIEEGIDSRITYQAAIYDPIEQAMAGSVVNEDIKDFFASDLGTNEARSIMLSKAAAFDTSAISIELKPRLKDSMHDSALQTTELIGSFNKFLNSEFSVPKYDFVFSDAILYSRAFPMAVTLIGWDDNIVVGSDTENIKGDISCSTIPLSDFWWDPAASNIEECDYVFTSSLYSYRRLKKELKGYDDFNEELLEAVYNTRIAIQTNASQQSETSSVSPNYNKIDKGAISLTTVFKKVYGEGKEPNHIKLYFVVSNDIVIATTTWKISMLPFAILKEQSVPNSFTGVSSVMMALNKIKELFILDSTLTDRVIQTKSPIYLISATSGIDASLILNSHESNLAQAQYVNGDINNAVTIVPQIPLDQQMLAYRQQILSDIDRLTSSVDLINGVTNSSITGAAVRSKEEQATIKENTSIMELKKYLVRFTSIVMDFMLNNFFNATGKKDSSRWLRYKNDLSNRGSDKYNFFELRPDDVKALIAEIDIDTTLLRASKKQQQANDLIQLYQIGLQYKSTQPIVTIEEIIDVLHIPNKEVILERIKKENQGKEVETATKVVEMVIQILQQQDPATKDIPIPQLVEMILQDLNQQQLPTNPTPKGGA